MGARGPLPQSPELHILKGNPSKKSKADLQPKRKLAPSTPTPPTWINKEAKAEWIRVAKELNELGILSKIDRAVLTVYCQTWALYVELDRKIQKEGVTVIDSKHGLKKNPAWQMWRESATVLQSYAKELGLSPGARLRLNMPDSEDESDGDDILD